MNTKILKSDNNVRFMLFFTSKPVGDRNNAQYLAFVYLSRPLQSIRNTVQSGSFDQNKWWSIKIYVVSVMAIY